MDNTENVFNLSMKKYRRNTFKKCNRENIVDLKLLSDLGFYYDERDLYIKCYVCKLNFNYTESTENIIQIHKEKKPNCKVSEKILIDKVYENGVPKTIISRDIFRFEKQRLETFIEWPLNWMSPHKLAADGFFYLRTLDHCACYFCNIIIGAWYRNDVPRDEHKRLSPNCPFINGMPVGNITLLDSVILDKLPLEGEEYPIPLKNNECITFPSGTRLMSGSYTECKGQPRMYKTGMFENLMYETYEQRFNSYGKYWPERISQDPHQLASAGFYYCNLKDIVMCFKCGGGIHNWEIDEDPVEQHIRWYPDCLYIRIFINEKTISNIILNKPLFIRFIGSNNEKPKRIIKSSGKFNKISDNDISNLLNLDIISYIIKNKYFSIPTVKMALKKKLETTGLPFFYVREFIIYVNEMKNVIYT